MLSNLGFGMMRLPVKNGNPVDFDFDQLNPMVDAFLTAGFTYFDTSYVYHNGKSEYATHEAVVARHPRDSFTVATKFPTFAISSEEEVEPIFASQLKNLGVDYVDYYLLHNIQTVLYDGIDGKGGIVKKVHLFEHAEQWKREGKIKHLGFSFHSSAELLDRVLTDHPDVDFVQIALNYIDWDSAFVQARKCYDVIRKHGKQVVIMEPVKGGGLAKLPAEAEALLKAAHPDWSIVSWAIRFAGSLPGVIAVLSGMSTLSQVLDNTKTAKEAQPLTQADLSVLKKAARIYRDSAPMPVAELDTYNGLTWHGIPVRDILETWSICQIQPDPGFADDNNYFRNVLAEKAHLEMKPHMDAGHIVLADGTDVTGKVQTALDWLCAHSF